MPWQRKEVPEVGVACLVFFIHTEMDAIFQPIKKSDTYQIKLSEDIVNIRNERLIVLRSWENELGWGSDKSSENRFAVHGICHVPHPSSFSNERRKKDTHSLNEQEQDKSSDTEDRRPLTTVYKRIHCLELSGGGGGGYKTKGNIISFRQSKSGAHDGRFGKLFLIRDANNFDKNPNDCNETVMIFQYCGLVTNGKWYVQMNPPY